MNQPPAARLLGIAKRFGSVQALRGADFALAPGDIHALLGENGAGKSTLMHVLFGLLAPDAGLIEVGGRPVRIGRPREAMDLGIGMVHQHFTQVGSFTVAENVWLGQPGVRTDAAAAAAAVRRVGDATGLTLDPAARAGDLPVGLRQRLEIIKALARDVRVLILDEPTAALTPREVDDLFAALRRLRERGVAVVLITHKLREVLAIADHVTVLRQGAVVLSERASAVNAEVLAGAMIGAGGARAPALAPAPASAATPVAGGGRPEALTVRSLTVRAAGRLAVRDVDLAVGAGEIVGIAAVEGNGARELLRAIAGLLPHQGKVAVGGNGVVGFVPEDRQHEGLLMDFDLSANLALGRLSGLWLRPAERAAEAERLAGEFGIRSGAGEPLRTFSGGNQQKVVLARALASPLALLVAENPTRGLDVHATGEVHDRLRRAARAEGAGVLFHSADLDEVLALADRVAVMADGRWLPVAPAARSREAVGALMLGAAA